MKGESTMNENKTAQSGATTGFCCSSLTPRQMLAAQLREMSHHVSDIDRCILCKAAEELDKPENSSMSWAFPLLALALAGGCDGFDIDPDA